MSSAAFADEIRRTAPCRDVVPVIQRAFVQAAKSLQGKVVLQIEPMNVIGSQQVALRDS